MDVVAAVWIPELLSEDEEISPSFPSTIRFHHVELSTMNGDDEIVISGVVPDGYNGTYTIRRCTMYTCEVLKEDDPGTYVSGGEIS